MSPFCLSIENKAGETKQYGFHLGTDEALARTIVQEKMAAHVANALPVVTMALMRDGKLVDTLYREGRWHSETSRVDFDCVDPQSVEYFDFPDHLRGVNRW